MAPTDRSPIWSPDFLSEISVAVVAALEADDNAATAQLADRIANLEARARATKDEDLATYFGVLRRLLAGDDPGEAAAALVEPYRSGFERIRHELAASQDDPAAPAPTDWLASLTSMVAATARHGSREERLRLEQELGHTANRSASDDAQFLSFVDALRAVLRGEDTRQRVIGLQPPYRDAFLSLLQLLAAPDSAEFTREALLDRVQHNTIVALARGNREVQAAVAATLADLSQQLNGEADVEDLRALLQGAAAVLTGREPSPSVDTLPEPYATVWREILAAAEKAVG